MARCMFLNSFLDLGLFERIARLNFLMDARIPPVRPSFSPLYAVLPHRAGSASEVFDTGRFFRSCLACASPPLSVEESKPYIAVVLRS